MFKTNKKIILKLLLFLLLIPFLGSAETLYFEPEGGEYRIGEKFILELRVDTGGECINAAEIHFSYPTDKFTAKEFMESRSNLTLWLQPAQIYKEIGTVTFSAGVPGGFCPPEGESVLLGEVLMEVNEIHRETIERIRFWGLSRVLLNDGQATPLDFKRKSAYLTLLPERDEEGRDPMQDRIEEDREPPKIFDLKIKRDPSLFGGDHFLIFSAEDRGSGIDYFKISEQKRIGFITAESEKWDRWDRAESPYVLSDQRLRSVIKVRAVDKAGNETVKVIEPPYGAWDLAPWTVSVLVVFLIIYILKKRKESKEMNIEW